MNTFVTRENQATGVSPGPSQIAAAVLMELEQFTTISMAVLKVVFTQSSSRVPCVTCALFMTRRQDFARLVKLWFSPQSCRSCTSASKFPKVYFLPFLKKKIFITLWPSELFAHPVSPLTCYTRPSTLRRGSGSLARAICWAVGTDNVRLEFSGKI